MRPTYVLQIARFTLQEAVSRRLILAGVLISLGYIGLFALGFHFAYDKSIETTTSVESRLSLGVAFATLTLFGVYVVNYLASFLALFLSVAAISGEIDSGTLHAVLARPLRRSEFVIGRWLGYAVTLSLFGSTLMPTLANGIVVFTLLGLAWLAGIIEFVGRLLTAASNSTGGDAMLNIGTAVSLILPSDALWRGASYYLESPSMLAVLGAARGGIPFFSSTPPAPALVVWAVGYVVVILAGAVLAFRRRDL